MKNFLLRILLVFQLGIYTVLYPFIPRYRKARIFFLGRMISVPDFASFYSSYIEIFVNQIYYFSEDVNKKHVIIDAGANIGVSVIYFSLLYPNSKIIAIEADPEIFGFLMENLDMFDVKDHVVSINKAIWAESSIKIPFYPEGADGGRAKNKLAKVKPIYVNTTMLQDLWKKKIDFLKIDVEGVEYEVLKDQMQVLKRTNKAFVEYHSFSDLQQNLSDLLRVIKESGLRVTMIKTMSNRKSPLIKRTSNLDMDLQLNIFLTK